jgi:hypothetical protein
MDSENTLDEAIAKERFRKAKIIIDCYGRDRTHTQEDVAKELNISVDIVRRVTKLYNYWHTKKLTLENLNEGQTINPLIFAEQLAFLDKVDI